MKIAVTAAQPSLDGQVDPRFGRCPYFLIVDPDTLAFEAVRNPNVIAVGGAGIRSAQLIATKGAEVVLSGNYGPNAAQTLNAVGVKMIAGVMGGAVREAIEQFRQGLLEPVSQPTVGPYFGMGVAPGQGQAMGRGRGIGRGGRKGMGRGMGRGIGPGRGMGRGGGPGDGPGGMGRGMTQGTWGPINGDAVGVPPRPAPGTPSSTQSELETLKRQAEMMAQQLKEITKLIEELERSKGQSQEFKKE